MSANIENREVVPWGPIPVTVLAGFAGPGKAALIGRWLVGRPVGQRWAVVLNESAPSAFADFADSPNAPNPLDLLDLRGACVCCAALPVLRARLPALLRRRPAHLLVELGETADPAAVIRLLSGEAWRRWLMPPRVVAVIDAGRVAASLGEPPATPAECAHAAAHLRSAQAVQVVGERLDERQRRALVAGDATAAAAPHGPSRPALRVLCESAAGQWLAATPADD